MSYSTVFGAGVIFPSDPTFRSFTLAANVTLSWPADGAVSGDVLTNVLEAAATSNGLTITLPSAAEASTGQATLVANRGSFDFVVANAAGSSVATIAAGAVWMLYIADNATPAGVWRALQFGSTTTLAQAGTLAGGGLAAFGGLLVQSQPATPLNSNFTASNADRAKTIAWTGGVGTITLPLATGVTTGWFLIIKNAGTGVLTVAAASNIDGLASITLNPGDSCTLCTDGATFYSLGRNNASAAAGFDYVTVSMAGAGDYTISGAQLNRVSYLLSGVLTGNRNFIVPTSVQQYWISNQTSGGFTITVETASGTGIVVPQGQAMILYCDGVNVVNAATAGISTPISVANGGTGATTATAARANLGSTSVGDALYTAASTTAVRATLDVYATSESVASDLLYALVMS